MKPRTTELSRRSALAGLSVAAAAGVAALPAGAAAAGAAVALVAADPIHAVIAAHSEAVEHEMACHKASLALENSLPDDRTTWHHYVGHSETPPDGCADAPEWIASELAMLRAYECRSETVEALLTTAPTTLAGALDFLEYLGSPEFPGSHESLMSSICQNYHDEDLLTNLVATMRGLIGEQS
jgi:hypothetical protein